MTEPLNRSLRDVMKINFERSMTFRDRESHKGITKMGLYKIISRTCIHHELVDTCKFHDRNSTCYTVCDKFQPFENNPFITRDAEHVFIKQPSDIVMRERRKDGLKHEFATFLFKMFRMKGLTYDDITYIFYLSIERCRRLISTEFKNCCIKKGDDCVFKKFLE